MGKTAWMFPGQGAQYIGMAASFYQECRASKEAFEQASQAVGFDIADLVFHENDKINQTEYTQIALYTTEIAIMRAVQQKFTEPTVTLGLSLGEYSALTASKSLDFVDGCKIVRQRGIFMEHEVPDGSGSMAAVLGMSATLVDHVVSEFNQKQDEEACLQGKTVGIHAYVANYNCPGQIVISGETQTVTKLMSFLKEAGAKRVIPLNVSGPFHSPMLIGAGQKLEQILGQFSIATPQIPYVANYHAEYVTQYNSDEAMIKDLLVKQVSSSVHYEQSIRRLIGDGIDTFIEIGPGKTLTGFVNKIAKDMGKSDITLKNIEKIEDLHND